jgi:autotransporter adhesin
MISSSANLNQSLVSVSANLNAEATTLSSSLNTALVSVSANLNGSVVTLSSQINSNTAQISAIANDIAMINRAASTTSTSASNTAYGWQSAANMSGTGNVSVGSGTSQGTTGSENVAVGESAGASVVGSTNTGVGTLASSTVSGSYNSGSGYAASRGIIGDRNVGMGAFSSTSIEGFDNSGIGYVASANVVGDGNTAAGASSGQSVTGNANSALGIGAGQSVTGNANIAIGQNAGSAGAVPITASMNSEARALESVHRANLAVQGSNNIAIGTNAGMGNGNAFSNTLAIGTNASAVQTSAVALGANAIATAPNAVAIGAGSVANQADTVSVGSATSQRRITNVASGADQNDAATFGQLVNATNNLSQGISKAYKGIAMSQAASSAVPVTTRPGETAIALGTGYFEGNTAIGFGIAGASRDGGRVVRIASALTPGFDQVSMQASYQMRVGRAAPVQVMLDASKVADMPFAVWHKANFTNVHILTPGLAYQFDTLDGDRTFKVAVTKVIEQSGYSWDALIEELTRDGEWHSLNRRVSIRKGNDAQKVLKEAIKRLSAFVEEDESLMRKSGR